MFVLMAIIPAADDNNGCQTSQIEGEQLASVCYRPKCLLLLTKAKSGIEPATKKLENPRSWLQVSPSQMTIPCCH